MSDCRPYMFHGEKEMADGHDLYDAPNIFKAVVDQIQVVDLESRTFMFGQNFRGIKIGVTLSLMS